MSADPRERWAERLAVPVDAAPEVAAAAFLRALPGDLLPSVEEVTAASVLTAAALPTGAPDALEEALREELNAFADRFWALPPTERLLQWADLSRRGANPVRLRELEPGLDVTAPAFDDPTAEELAEQFRVLFVLPPRERAIQRTAWLVARADNANRWRSAFEAVQREAPALVALEPRLQTAFDATFDPDALAAGANEAPGAPDARSADRNWMSGSVETNVAERLRESSNGGPPSRLIGTGAIIGMILLFRILIVAFGRSDAPKPSYTPERFSETSVPSHTPPSDLGAHAPRRQFTEAEVTEFRKYESDLATGKNPHTPPAHTAWVLAGRPPAVGTNPLNTQLPQRPKFTPEEVAACVVYEGERRNGQRAQEPAVYPAWVRAGRPRDALALPEPAPDEVRVSFSSYQILACQRYERSTGLTRPPVYDDWVKAGKPTEPGTHIIPKPKSEP